MNINFTSSYKFINNSNNYIIIPFGHRCASALACKYASLRNQSLPFDWTIPLYPSKSKEILKSFR